jgi:hypothetical protein
MSVGFSVDFASHVAYSFMSIDSDDANLKLSGALRSVGWPITQTSTAIFLGNFLKLNQQIPYFHNFRRDNTGHSAKPAGSNGLQRFLSF